MRREGREHRRGSLLLEAIFGLFLLGVTGLASVALVAHALSRFEVAEARARAVPVAGGWLEDPHPDSLVLAVGPGELAWSPGQGAGAFPGGEARFLHPRGAAWAVPRPPAATGFPP